MSGSNFCWAQYYPKPMKERNSSKLEIVMSEMSDKFCDEYLVKPTQKIPAFFAVASGTDESSITSDSFGKIPDLRTTRE